MRCANAKPKAERKKHESGRKSIASSFQVQRPTSSEYILEKDLDVKRAPWSNDEEFLLANIICHYSDLDEVCTMFMLHQRCMRKHINAREMLQKQISAKYKLMKTNYDMFILTLKS